MQLQSIKTSFLGWCFQLLQPDHSFFNFMLWWHDLISVLDFLKPQIMMKILAIFIYQKCILFKESQGSFERGQNGIVHITEFICWLKLLLAYQGERPLSLPKNYSVLVSHLSSNILESIHLICEDFVKYCSLIWSFLSPFSTLYVELYVLIVEVIKSDGVLAFVETFVHK